jgi:UDP-glucose:(heptosyl)LPS alpha-1,3-glucosyltransferase
VKLAFVHRRFGVDGGTERFLESLARRLGERGHEVHVWAASVDPRYVRTRVATFHRLPGGRGLLGALALMAAAALAVRRPSYDAVLHLGRTGPGDVYRAGGGCHRAWFEHLLADASGLARWRVLLSPYHQLRLWHERRALGSTARVIVPSERARADFVRCYGALGERVEVLPNGVDLDRFHPKGRQLFFEEVRRQLGLPPEELVLLFVGSDFHRKGLDTVLKAVQRLGDDAADLRILVLGSDGRRARFEALAAELGLRDRVTFLREHDQPEKVYAACDALALPTRYDPFANVSLEALASGLPVVTSARNGALDVVPANTALVVVDDPDDADAVAAGIRSLLGSEGMGERRAAARAAAATCGEAEAVLRWEALLEGARGPVG